MPGLGHDQLQRDALFTEVGGCGVTELVQLPPRVPGEQDPGEDKKASAAAWTVLVSRSRRGMIFPVICSSSADVPDNVPESRARRRAASRVIAGGYPSCTG